MKVWQPGGHLTQRRERRRSPTGRGLGQATVSTLRAHRAVQPRTALAVVSLLAATLTGLPRPARKVGGRRRNLGARPERAGWIVVAFFAAGLVNLSRRGADLLHRLDRRADPGRPAQQAVPPPPAALARVLRANRAGVIISRLTNDVDALDQLVTDGVSSLVQSTLTLIGTAMILFFLDWRLALATLTVIPLIVATALFRIRSSRAYRAVRERLGNVTATLAEDIAGIRVVQSFRASRQTSRFQEVNAHYRQANQQTVVLNGLYFPFVDFLSAVATAVVVGYGGWLASQARSAPGRSSPSSATSRTSSTPCSSSRSSTTRSSRPLRRWTRSWRSSTRSPRSATSRTRSRSRGSAATSASKTSGSATATCPRCCTASISMSRPARRSRWSVNRSRQVDDREAPRPLLRPARGAITIDGMDLRDVKQESLRRQLGIVPQEGFLFAGTVRQTSPSAGPTRRSRRSSRRRGRSAPTTSSWA